MVRSAAKNYQHVAIVTDPADYAGVLKEMAATSGAVGAETRFALAQKAFSHTAAYDGAISNYLTALDAAGDKRERLSRRGSTCTSTLAQPLRYGENPHQHAAFYRDSAAARRQPRHATGSSRARSSRTTTSPMPTRRGNA